MTNIGIDLVKISRIQHAVERWGDRFLKRVFSSQEIDYCYQKKGRAIYASLAVRFAAKEAFIKAVSEHIQEPVSWKDCEIGILEGGKPTLLVSECFRKQLFDANPQVSLSHDGDYAIALVFLNIQSHK